MPVGQQVQTTMGQVIAIVVGAVVFLAAVATVLDWLGFVPNGPHIVSRIKARIQAPGKRRKLMQERADWAYDMAKHLLDPQELLMKSDRWAQQKLESLPPEINQIKQDIEGIRM